MAWTSGTTETVSGTGFSRGVEGAAVGRFKWDNRPSAGHHPRRFAAVAQLLSIEHNRRLRLRAFCEDDGLPVLPSLTGVWPGGTGSSARRSISSASSTKAIRICAASSPTTASSAIRSARIPADRQRRVRYDPEQQRVVYEPVSIEPRVLVPRVIRDDADLAQARAEAADDWRRN